MRNPYQKSALLHLLTFLLSFPILGGAIWLNSRANNIDCMKFLQWPLIAIAVSIMVVSLAGFAGACYRNTFLMRLYLFAMLFNFVVLLAFIIFALIVTRRGSGRRVMNRSYLDYYLDDYYSGWLKERVASDSYWRKISSCIRDSEVCARMGRTINGIPETADMFYLRKLSPIRSGCCKPPTKCGYIYQNETMWDLNKSKIIREEDCKRWSNEQQQLCYDCNSCKAGVLASLKLSWSLVSVINLIVMTILFLLGLPSLIYFIEAIDEASLMNA